MPKRVSETAIHNESGPRGLIEWPTRQLDPEIRVYCAYNPLRQKFLCPFIETADVMPEDLREILDRLTPGSKKAIWLMPFRGVAPSQVNAPIDMVFLDQNHAVLAMEESFPRWNAETCNWPVGSAIALPAGTIASSGTLAGDQLILCSPEKMKEQLADLEGTDAAEVEIISHSPDSVATPNFSIGSEPDQNPSRDDLQTRHAPEPSHVPQRQEDVRAPEPEVETPVVTDLAEKERNWLLCLLAPHSKEKRMTPRESLPWIAAYFFTGGAPAPAGVRDISSLGMYVQTSERWYPGTIIRVTLSDLRLSPPGRAITVNAMAVRSDDGGVGLRFVFPKPPKRKTGNPDHRAMVDSSREEVRKFLQPFSELVPPTTWGQ